MAGTIRPEDMPLFARVAQVLSFTAAAKQLQMPKQTLSRRVAELEQALGVVLLVPVLGEPVEVGAVWLVHPAGRFLPARVRAFVDLARQRFGQRAPWLIPSRARKRQSLKSP